MTGKLFYKRESNEPQESYRNIIAIWYLLHTKIWFSPQTDGLWKQNYDSVYLGKIELDNGEIFKNANTYVIKDYYNHTPLSYHYINKFTLGDTFDENSDYQIM